MASLEQKFAARPKGGRKQQGLVAALDLGATKIVCLIAEPDATTPEAYRIIGAGQQASRGVKNGAVIDMEGLERSIRMAVEDAERQAGQQIDTVHLALGGSHVTCEHVRGEVVTGGEEISSKDMDRALQAAVGAYDGERRELLHALPAGYVVDGNSGVRDPRGMFADSLGADVNMISVPKPPYKNLLLCVSRSHLEIDAVAASALLSAEAVLVEDERETGAICIDLGGGTTGVAVYQDHGLQSLVSLPVGGMHITGDIAQGVGTTFAAAERIKTLSGTVLASHGVANEMIEAPCIGDDGRLQAGRIPQKELVTYIKPRVDEIFELVRDQLNAKCGRGGYPRRAVLTGGGSQLPGLREVAANVMNMPVRLGVPKNSSQLGENFATPAFSTAVGLLEWSFVGSTDAIRAGIASGTKAGERGQGGLVKKTLGWLKDNF